MIPDESITYTGLIFAALLLLPVILINLRLKLRLNKQILISVLRMALQLAVAVVYLNFLFSIDNLAVNIAYLIAVVTVSCFSVLHSAKLRFKMSALPVFLALLLPHAGVLLFFNAFVLNISDIFSAKYLITIGGMILGNCLKSAILSIEGFLGRIKSSEGLYTYALLLGASRYQALSPYINDALKKSVNPVIASMAATGLIALPGMATGQILGGSNPMTAVMYQCAILIAIFSAQYFSSVLSIFFISRSAFDGFDVLRKDIFKK